MYSIENLDNANLGDEGCRLLTKNNWLNLKDIDLGKGNPYLGKNNISAEGCLYLSQAFWPNLTSMKLGKK